MTAPGALPCAPWATDFPCKGLPEVDASVLETNLTFASWLMWALSGRKYGVCSEVVRPCTQPTRCIGWNPTDWPPEFWYEGVPIGWDYRYGYPCECATRDACGHASAVRLWRRNINAVTAVKINGEVLPTDAYRVDDWRWLTRIDGEGGWPSSQDFSKADTEDGTWSVAYTYGAPPPAAGIKAVQILACELTKDDIGVECALPSRTTSVNRQGLSYTLLDPTELLEKRRTGIFQIDLFLTASNPTNAIRPPRIIRADERRQGARRIGT